MSRADVDAAVERIVADAEYAEAVADQGAAALEPFDLTDDEQAAVLAAVERARQGSEGDVEGYGALPSLGLIRSPVDPSSHENEIQIMSFSWGASQVSSVGGAGGSGAGKADLSDIKLIKP